MIPVGMVLVSLYLLIAPIVDDPRVEFLYAALFVLGGLVFYVPLVHFKVQVKGYGTCSYSAKGIVTSQILWYLCDAKGNATCPIPATVRRWC